MTTSTQSRLGEAPEEGVKAPVKAISSGPLALFDVGMDIAGYTVADNDRIAVNGQASSADNGIYIARQGRSWTRATDFNNSDDVINGQLVVDANTSAVYIINVTAPWDPGNDDVDFGLLLSPVGFFWGAIGGTLSDQGDLQAELDAKSDVGHTHVEADITDLQAYLLDAPVDANEYGRSGGGWVDLNLNARFAALSHTHVEADITDLQAYLTDAPVDGDFYARKDGNWEMITTAAGTIGEIVMWPFEDTPANFLPCDGSSVSTSTFGELFAIIGYRYGGTGGSFNLPDLRGEFVRGWANGSGNDPDRTSRTDAGDGTTGDFVGTKQGHQFASHRHSISGGGSDDDGGPRPPGGTSNTTPIQTNLAGGSETRPRNVYMKFIIRYSGGGSGEALPPSVTIQDNGVEVASAVELINFLNFNIDVTAANQLDISFGVSKAAGIYSPGYTSYTRVDDDELTVDLVNAENLFYVGRRIRITDDMGAFTYGNVTAVDFNITSANDTHITLNMDGAEVVPTTINNVSLISSDTQWSPISGDPFSGNSINDIVYGNIGGTDYLVAVGQGGRMGWSDDGGLNWTMLTTGTSEDLNVCTFDSDNEVFWAGGNAGVLVDWDGTTLNLDTTSIPALATDGNSDIHGLAYSTVESAILLMFEYALTGSARKLSSTDQGASWGNAATLGVQGHNKTLVLQSQSVGNTGPAIYSTLQANTTIRILSNQADTSWSTSDSLGGGNIPYAFAFFDDGTTTNIRMYGLSSGGILGFNGWTGDDSTTFVSPIRDFAWSPTHLRLVCVGDNQQIGYLDQADAAVNNAWTAVANGFDPLANILAVEWDPGNGNFVAVADNGQICRSSNGLA